MDLQEFIKETISSIAEATLSLQEEFATKGLIVNPPTNQARSDTFDQSAAYNIRRVESVHFDVAVTATSETAGGAKGGLKVLSVEVGGHGTHAQGSERVSRVQFSIPVALPASNEEGQNKQKLEEAARQKRGRRQVRAGLGAS